jgi:hypothetical protein
VASNSILERNKEIEGLKKELDRERKTREEMVKELERRI